MQAIPSLIGAGSGIAAAAVGLVFGQPTDSMASPPPSNGKELKSDVDRTRRHTISSRPGTGYTAHALYAENEPPKTVQPALPVNPALDSLRQGHTARSDSNPPKSSSRRASFMRPGEWAPPPISEIPRDSISSSGSWMRRLSIRPLSQHGSPRSSVGPDSPSIAFSYGSAAPMLSPTGAVLPQLPPNKLVKRATSRQATESGTGLARRGSRSQMPTLRRPATSHQRSATLQRFQPQGDLDELPPLPKFSMDQPNPPNDGFVRTQVGPTESSQERPHDTPIWVSFFHSQISKVSPSNHSRPKDESPSNNSFPSRRVQLRQGGRHRAYLTVLATLKATPTSTPQPTEPHTSPDSTETQQSASEKADASNETTPSKKPRRSISTHFSSPGDWIASKTGSLRRSKRGSVSKDGGKRQVSAPLSRGRDTQPNDIEVGVMSAPERDTPDAAAPETRQRKRNSSSPLPPLNRFSSFDFDLGGMASSASAELQPSPRFLSQQPSTVQPQSRQVANECASTVTASDFDGRGFTSGDDDDTDFKSDTMFDSLRTMCSIRRRAVETPVESMFDESPPSTAGNGKTKRLSIQEILGHDWDGDTKITEEDEGVSTPVRQMDSSQTGFNTAEKLPNMQDNLPLGDALCTFSWTERDFGRLSLDDEEEDDDDWANEEENGLSNHLSPPSSSMNSRTVSPNVRLALASISGNGYGDNHQQSQMNDRPRSNIFDWSESSTHHEKFDADGQSLRPKTVHGKQELDLRGGRSASRRMPSSAHIRSQSVPVVPELSDNSSHAPKFGTWALGTKTVSEDWDDDFDFDENQEDNSQGKEYTTSFAMVVPASIQVTQHTVKAHSGQIRQLSLLVKGLKRLCRQARDLDIADGHSAHLWKEAENIIALASPDEELTDESDMEAETDSIDFDPRNVDERFLDQGLDATSLHKLDDPFEFSERNVPRTAVVKERQTARRRSVFSPDDDIFGGNWPLRDDAVVLEGPQTPDRPRTVQKRPDSAVIASVMEAMEQQRATETPKRLPIKPSHSKLFFDTNSLQELVKSANTLFHMLSDLVRKSELLTQSPAVTPKHDRHKNPDGSPAFTRVFNEPPTTPRRLPKSHSNNSVLSSASIDSPPSNGMGSRMQMMTVN